MARSALRSLVDLELTGGFNMRSSSTKPSSGS
jgi:hypothetical protein